MLAGMAPDVPATAVSPAAAPPSTAMSFPLSLDDNVEAWASAGRGGSANPLLDGPNEVPPGRESPLPLPLPLLCPALPLGAEEVEGRASEEPGANEPNELNEDMVGRKMGETVKRRVDEHEEVFPLLCLTSTI